MWNVAFGGRDRSGDEHRTIGDPRRSGEHCDWANDLRNSVCLLRQDDPVSVMVGGDEFDDVISGHPVTVGRKAGTQCSEDEEQEAGQQPMV